MKKAAFIFLIAVVFVVTIASCGAGCDSSYVGVCIPPPPPDLNCEDIKERNFEVRGSDPHDLDGDHDGKGCE